MYCIITGLLDAYGGIWDRRLVVAGVYIIIGPLSMPSPSVLGSLGFNGHSPHRCTPLASVSPSGNSGNAFPGVPSSSSSAWRG